MTRSLVGERINDRLNGLGKRISNGLLDFARCASSRSAVQVLWLSE